MGTSIKNHPERADGKMSASSEELGKSDQQAAAGRSELSKKPARQKILSTAPSAFKARLAYSGCPAAGCDAGNP